VPAEPWPQAVPVSSPPPSRQRRRRAISACCHRRWTISPAREWVRRDGRDAVEAAGGLGRRLLYVACSCISGAAVLV
jgi:hypothetical protein